MMRPADAETYVDDYREYVSPQRVAGFEAFEWTEDFVRAEGAVLVDREDREYIDMAAGFGVAGLGHCPESVRKRLEGTLRSGLPGTMPFAIPHHVGALAKALCERGGGRLSKVYFANSGAEGIEAALKFALATTGRSRFVAAEGNYHGLTFGALAMMPPDSQWRAPFGGLPQMARTVAVGDVEAVEAALEAEDVAAVVLEPIQGVGGGHAWSKEAAQVVQALCRAHGALLVLDEVLTGVGRTGRWFAYQHLGLDPDVVVTSKGLTAGWVPLSAVLMSDAVHAGVFGGPHGAGVHGSTFSGNLLAMSAGLAVLEAMDDEGVLERVARAGGRLRAGLEALMQDGLPITELRGRGLLQFVRIHGLSAPADPDGALACMRTLRDLGVVTTLAPHDPCCLKLTPPLTVEDHHLDGFLERLREVLELILEALDESACAAAPSG